RRAGGDAATASDPLFSPDGRHLAFVGRIPAGAGLVVADADGSSPQLIAPVAETKQPPASAGRPLAFVGPLPAGAGLVVADADGSSPQLIAPVEETNHPLPSSGARLAWAPHSAGLAVISGPAGAEADANGDPMVITRYLYKPTASEGGTRANDNRRLHIFVADVGARSVKQLTDGVYYEHSLD